MTIIFTITLIAGFVGLALLERKQAYQGMPKMKNPPKPPKQKEND